MELKEGMYIRSKDKRGNQFIRKIVELPTIPVYGAIVVDKEIHNVKWVSKKNVLKASNSIIDLIEVGDYINGYKVLFKDKDFNGNENIKCIDSAEERQCFYEKDIKSIVTKEQFKNMEYEVE